MTRRMFTWIWIYGIVLFDASGPRVVAVKPHYTCEEFELGARFDPYQTIDSIWKIVYFWGNTTEVYPISFTIPKKQRINKFREVLDATDPELGVEWHKATLVMEPRPGLQVLMLYAGTPGAFRAIVRKERRDAVRPYPAPLIKFADIRMKIVDGVMGMMCCEDLTKYVLTRLDEVPGTEAECEAAAAKLGFTERGGRSHLSAWKDTLAETVNYCQS